MHTRCGHREIELLPKFSALWSCERRLHQEIEEISGENIPVSAEQTNEMRKMRFRTDRGGGGLRGLVLLASVRLLFDIRNQTLEARLSGRAKCMANT